MDMNTKRIVVGAIVGLCLVGCTSPAEKTPSNSPTASVAGVPVNKYCPVDPTSKIDPTVTYMYEGKTYGFCCKDCIAEFKKDPAKYAAEAK
jgi:YHS domain-containing protein